MYRKKSFTNIQEDYSFICRTSNVILAKIIKMGEKKHWDLSMKIMKKNSNKQEDHFL